MTRAQKIYEIATEFIRSSSFGHSYWRATSISELRASPPIPFVLAGDEYPIVSASLPGGDWYVWTTRRLVSSCEGIQYEADAETIIRADLGNLRWQPQDLSESAPIYKRKATFYSEHGVVACLQYETGFAGLALTYCYKYWRIKHPILDKLMTPKAIARYRENKRLAVPL